MRTKKEVYKKDQKEIINKIIKIIGIEDKKQITLYELDNDLKIQNEIINLIPEIRKYFNFKNITGAIDPEKIKRPWLSIIKHILKNKYEIKTFTIRIKKNNIRSRTQKYCFSDK
jgi:hypothetical protein